MSTQSNVVSTSDLIEQIEILTACFGYQLGQESVVFGSRWLLRRPDGGLIREHEFAEEIERIQGLDVLQQLRDLESFGYRPARRSFGGPFMMTRPDGSTVREDQFASEINKLLLT